jgi:uncharacterized phage protein (TIGR01671 family)
MNREIKFRAWDKKYKTMASFDEMESRKHRALSVADASQFMVLPMHENVGLMQFTGLKDKNGKEIYEGDIFLTIFQDPRVIIFQAGAFCAAPPHDTGTPVAWQNGDDEPIEDIEWVSTSVEIVGNIYENPELLK